MEPALQTLHVAKGRITCAVCFKSSSSKNIKRAGLHKITDIEKFKQTAASWQNYEHDYSTVYSKHDWTNVTILYIHNNCRNFNRDTYMMNQPLKVNDVMMQDETEPADDTAASEGPSDAATNNSTIRRSR